MAVTFFTGFDNGAVSVDNVLGFVGTAAYDTGTVRTGARSVRCNPASSAAGNVQVTPPTSGWFHFAIRLASLPSVTRTIVGQAGANGLVAKITSAGAIQVLEDTTLIGTSSTTLSTNVWYWIGLRVSTGTGVVFLQINGSNEVTGTATITQIVNGYVGPSATEASAIDLYIDDMIADDAGFLAPSKVDCALPISDNTVSNVTGGAGGTTNLWDAINNTPPAGVASASETNTTNIEFPASVASDYIANCETYTTLGVGASDTIIAVQAIIRHGEDIATGTKTATIGSGNPSISGMGSITFGNNGGAHGAETGIWVTNFSPIDTSGAGITKGDSPRIQVTRASQARVGCVDFMGMMVAWTPFVDSPRVPRFSPYPQLLPR